MASIEGTGEIELREGNWTTMYRWVGYGWAKVPLDWTGVGWRGAFEPVIFQGNLWLRVLHVDRRGFPGWLYVVKSNNRGWPLWWILLRCYLLLSWVERAVRLTCQVWGLIEAGPGMEPRWGNFVGVRHLREWMGRNGNNADRP